MTTKPKTKLLETPKKLKKTDIFSFRMDTFEIFGNFPEKSKCFFPLSLGSERELDVQYKLDTDLEVEYSTRATKYLYKLIFSFNWVSCIEYHEGTQLSANIKTRNHIAVTGKAWKLLWQQRIFRIIERYFTFEGFRRLDIALDITLPITEILLHFSKLKQKWRTEHWPSWDIETYYIWAYKKADNRYKLIRLYNKILEIKANQTQALYSEYLKQSHITRIEIELREELCKFITWQQAKDPVWLMDTFVSNIQKHTKLFDDFQGQKIKLTRSKKSILETLEPEQIMNSQALKMFKGLAKSLKEKTICPIRYLVKEWVYDIDTLRDIFIAFDEHTQEFDKDFFVHGTTIRNVKNIFLE